MAKKKNKSSSEVSMENVCDYLGKKCFGPVKFYTKPNKKTGVRIIPQYPQTMGNTMAVSEAKVVDKKVLRIQDSNEFKAAKDKIKYSIMFDNTLIIKTKLNLDLSELTVDGEAYKISKLAYADSFIYSIKHPDIKKFAPHIVNAFTLSILADEKEKEEENELEKNNANDEEGNE